LFIAALIRCRQTPECLGAHLKWNQLNVSVLAATAQQPDRRLSMPEIVGFAMQIPGGIHAIVGGFVTRDP
jgi:hypothetical protein